MLALVALLLAGISPAPSPSPTGSTSSPPPIVAASEIIDWSSCSIYASGAAVRRGVGATVTRAGTEDCTCNPGGGQTAQANELCVTEMGAKFGGAEKSTVASSTLRLSTAGPISLIVEASTATNWGTGSNPVLFTVGDYFAPTGSLVGYVADGRFYCGVWDKVDSKTTNTSIAIPTNAGAGTNGIAIHRFGCEYNGGGNPVAYLDGNTFANMGWPTLQGGGTGTGQLGSIPAALSIGKWTYYAYWNGTISNVTICHKRMAECERANASRFRRTALREKKVLALGDSIVYGTGSTSGNPSTAWLPRLLTALGAPWQGVNGGVGGDRTDQISARYALNYAKSYFSHVVEEGGHNDCSQSVPAATIIARRRALWAAIRAAGATPIATLVTPVCSVTPPTRHQCVADVNAGITTAAAADGVAVVDLWTPLKDGSDCLAAAYDSGDALHPNQAGYNLIADTIAAAGVIY